MNPTRTTQDFNKPNCEAAGQADNVVAGPPWLRHPPRAQNGMNQHFGDLSSVAGEII